MTDYYAGQWLTHRIYGFVIQVVGTTPDGGVTVMSGSKQVNTSTSYLDWQYRELGAA